MAFHLVAGNLESDLRIVLDINGVAEDISDATAITMRWLKPDGSLVTERELVADAAGGGLAAGAVKCVWVEGETDEVGVHQAQVNVTRGNDEGQTFPSNGTYITWHVHAPLGA